MSRPEFDSLFRVQRLSEHMGPDTFFMFGPEGGSQIPCSGGETSLIRARFQLSNCIMTTSFAYYDLC